MSYDDYIQKATQSYYDFISSISIELESLKEMLKDKELIRQKSINFSNIISNKEKLLENKLKILELNNKLNEQIELLEFLNSKNNLDNAAADEAYNCIIEDVYIKNESTMPPELGNKIEELKNEINRLNRVFYSKCDYETLNEILDYYDIDENNKSIIIFGFILKENNLLKNRQNVYNDNVFINNTKVL